MTRTKHRATRHGGVDDIWVLPGRTRSTERPARSSDGPARTADRRTTHRRSRPRHAALRRGAGRRNRSGATRATCWRERPTGSTTPSRACGGACRVQVRGGSDRVITRSPSRDRDGRGELEAVAGG